MSAPTEIASTFKALADPVRLRLMRLVAVNDEVDGSTLIELSGLPRAAAYYHLRALVSAGVLTVRKEARSHYYRCDQDTIAAAAFAISDVSKAAGDTRVA